MLTEDNNALIGAPGPFTWRGTVFAVSVAHDFLFRDKTHYHTAVHPGDTPPVDKYSYLGMSLAAGNFLPPSRRCQQPISYAAGAPRARGRGSGRANLQPAQRSPPARERAVAFEDADDEGGSPRRAHRP